MFFAESGQLFSIFQKGQGRPPPSPVAICAPVSGLQLYQKETPTQVFCCEICEMFKNTFFYRTPRMAVSLITKKKDYQKQLALLSEKMIENGAGWTRNELKRKTSSFGNYGYCGS